ncbi:hypothetical protein G3I76_57810 [Streptomyces sp. SID11233]|nr:hypothetical protein [Streptomyces sp. SID11233]
MSTVSYRRAPAAMIAALFRAAPPHATVQVSAGFHTRQKLIFVRSV